MPVDPRCVGDHILHVHYITYKTQYTNILEHPIMYPMQQHTWLPIPHGDYASITNARPWTKPSACARAACPGVSSRGGNAIARPGHGGIGERMFRL